MHHRRPRLPLVLAVLVASALLPFAAGPASAGTDYAAICTANLRSAALLTATTLDSMPAGTVVTTEGIVAGDAYTASCPGPIGGDTWYEISAVNGVSVQARYGVPMAFAATGLFGPVPVGPSPTPTPITGATPPPSPVLTPPPPTYSYLEGIDVSVYQHTIDWTQVAYSGKSFAIMRASLGTTYADPTYPTNHAGAKAAGLQVAAYHYATPSSTPGDAVAEADWFVQNAALQPGDLIPALDIEQSGGLSVTALQAWVGAWLGEVYALVGVRPMIYTSPNFWKNALGNTTMFADQGYGVLWVAHWFVSSPTVPANSWGGHGWTFWQYDDCGSVAGISGCVDLDRYSGTDFSSVALGYVPPPPTAAPNPPPALTAVAPATLPSAPTTQTVTISGSGFAPGVSTAYLNGMALPTQYVSTTSLTATVPAGLPQGQGMLTVVNPPPGGGSSGAFPLSVTAAPAQISIAASSGVISWGGTVTLAVSVSGVVVGAGANRQVVLQRMQANETAWHDVTSGTTDSSGNASFSYRPPVNTQFQAVFAGTQDLGPATSAPVRVVVRQLLVLRPTNGGAYRSLPLGSKVTFTATVRPVGAGLAPATVSFRFWHLVSGRWVAVTTRNAAVDATGRANLTWKFTSRGKWYVRAIANPTTTNANSAWSQVERYSIY